MEKPSRYTIEDARKRFRESDILTPFLPMLHHEHTWERHRIEWFCTEKDEGKIVSFLKNVQAVIEAAAKRSRR